MESEDEGDLHQKRRSMYGDYTLRGPNMTSCLGLFLSLPNHSSAHATTIQQTTQADIVSLASWLGSCLINPDD